MLKNKVLKVIAIAIVLTTLCSGFASATIDLEDAFIAHVLVGADVATGTDTDVEVATGTDTDVEVATGTDTDVEVEDDVIIATATDTEVEEEECEECTLSKFFELLWEAIRCFFEWLC